MGAKLGVKVKNGLADSSNILAESCKIRFHGLAKSCNHTLPMPINKGFPTDRFTDINTEGTIGYQYWRRPEVKRIRSSVNSTNI